MAIEKELQTTRSTRHQPFCWQEKTVLRFLKTKFEGATLGKYRNLYLTLTEIDSDFNGRDIHWYTKTIATYSGLSDDWIPGALRTLKTMGVIDIRGDRNRYGRFSAREIVFTPEKFSAYEHPLKPGTGKSGTGKSAILEDSSYLEDNNIKKKDTPSKARAPRKQGHSAPAKKKNPNPPAPLPRRPALRAFVEARLPGGWPNRTPGKGAAIALSKRRKEIGDARFGAFIDWYVRTKGKDVWLKYDWNLLAKTSVYEQYEEGRASMTADERQMEHLRTTGDRKRYEKFFKELEEKKRAYARGPKKKAAPDKKKGGGKLSDMPWNSL